MGHGDLLFHITVGGLGCRVPGGQPGRRAGYPDTPKWGQRTRLQVTMSSVSCKDARGVTRLREVP